MVVVGFVVFLYVVVGVYVVCVIVYVVDVVGMK